ncbi:neprilysin-21-like [Dermacentor variabilis]|uniref:neprilysin-21-like n=1 Tax=Dermacentor variabilis TaxID=34621 RepID=UPI003F5C2E1E
MFVAAVTSVLAILLYLFTSIRDVGAPFKASRACFSDACLRDAVFLDQLLSWNVVWPCDNFYMFVCRQWRNQFAATPLAGSVSADDDYVANAEGKMYAILEDRSQGSSVLQPLRDLMDKCMDVEHIQLDGWDPLLAFMSEASMVTFPMTPPTRPSLSAWKTAGHVLRRTGTSALLSVGIAANPRVLNEDIVLIAPPEMLTDNRNIDVNEAVRLYTDAVFSAVKALRKEFVPAAYTLDIVKFAGNLEKLCESKSRERQSYKIARANTSSHLFTFVTEVLRSRESLAPRVRADVLIQSPHLVYEIVKLVENAELHTVFNYISLRLMIQTSPFIPQNDLTDFYGTLVHGKYQHSLPRWKLCLRVVEKTLFPLAYVSFLTNLSAHASPLKFPDAVSNAARELLHGVKTSPLFNAFSKAAIQKMFVKTRFKVLAPPWIHDDLLLKSYYQSLPTIKPTDTAFGSYVATFERVFAHTASRDFSEQWSHSAFSTNCYYDGSVRTVFVPLLVFNITAGVDAAGDYAQVPRAAYRVVKCILDMLFADADSTSGDESWLDLETRHRFEDAERCFGGSPEEVPLRPRGFPKLTDALAMKFAFNTFRTATASSRKAWGLRLPNGRYLTNDQLFFVFLVMQACERTGDRQLAAKAGATWNVVLRSYRDFHAALNCPLGSSMNQAGHCSI